MNNLSSYCGLTDSRMSASEKDLPVPVTLLKKYFSLHGVINRYVTCFYLFFFSIFIAL